MTCALCGSDGHDARYTGGTNPDMTKCLRALVAETKCLRALVAENKALIQRMKDLEDNFLAARIGTGNG